MRYAKNKIKGIVNGAIFYFEAGDEPIAADLLELFEESEKPPTSICWNSECLTAAEASERLETEGLARGDWLGIRLTVDDLPLLKEVLNLFKTDYPALLPMVTEIEGELFVTKH